MRWPSRRARRMPARTRSTIRVRSSSAMAPMITTRARPSGPPVSIFSRKLTYSTPIRSNSSSTSRKCFTDLAIRSEAQTKTHIEPAAAGVGHHLVKAGPFGLRAADSVGVLGYDLEAALAGHLPEVIQLRLRMLIDSADPHIEPGALHARLLFGLASVSGLGDVIFDELEKYDCHFEALRCGCGLERVVEFRWDIDVHAFYPCSFLLLDLTHLLPLEVSICDSE